jgi:hypothetical protein
MKNAHWDIYNKNHKKENPVRINAKLLSKSYDVGWINCVEIKQDVETRISQIIDNRIMRETAGWIWRRDSQSRVTLTVNTGQRIANNNDATRIDCRIRVSRIANRSQPEFWVIWVILRWRFITPVNAMLTYRLNFVCISEMQKSLFNRLIKIKNPP